MLMDFINLEKDNRNVAINIFDPPDTLLPSGPHYCEDAHIIYRLNIFSELISFHNTYYTVEIFKLVLLIIFYYYIIN